MDESAKEVEILPNVQKIVDRLKSLDQPEAKPLTEQGSNLREAREGVVRAMEGVDVKRWKLLGPNGQARERMKEFEGSKAAYLARREELFGLQEEDKTPKLVQVLNKITRNFTRWMEDERRRKMRHVDPEEVKVAKMEITVEDRNALLKDENKYLFENKANLPVLQAFMGKELYIEQNCTHFLRIKGTTIDQFHWLVEQLGYNPTTFLSDDRGENGGRLAVDNAPQKGKHPFLREDDLNYADEMRYWMPVQLPKYLKWWPGSEKWRMSRTHGVVYGVEGKDSQEELLIPIHMDPKNAVAAVGELFGKKKEDHGALVYHKMALGDKYVGRLGTGLYDLGCKYLIWLLRGAQKGGLIGDVRVQGEEDLRTTGSIVGDDRITWAINEMLAKQKV